MNHQDQILISLIETWNNKNLNDRLNADLVRIIDEHIGYALVSGSEQMKNNIIDKLELLINNNGLIRANVAIRAIKKI